MDDTRQSSKQKKIDKNNNDINKNNKNNDSYYLNNSHISNNQKILKNIYIHKGNELFIQKLKNINEEKFGEKHEMQKSKSFNYFKEKDLKNNMLINKIRRYNLSEKYLLNKQNKKNEYENNKEIYEKKDIKYNKKTNNNKLKNNKTYIENKKADIPIPNNTNYIIPLQRNNIKNNNKFIPKNHNIIYLKKKDSHKCLIKNNSDYGYINKSNSKDEKRLLMNRLQYPTLKNLLYYKIFPNKYNDNRTRNKNIKKVSINNSFNKNKVISIDKTQNQMSYDDNSSKDAHKKQNYSMENYLNNKFHLKISNDNLNNFIKRLKMKYQQKTVSEYKNINRNLNEKISNKNIALRMYRNIYKSFNDTNSLKDSQLQSENKIVKHSFSFLINKKKDIDYISIINRYKRKTNK